MAGRSGKNCGLKMPKRFADMTEEEMDYVGGEPWAVAAGVCFSLAVASGIAMMVTGFLACAFGYSKLEEPCRYCLISTLVFASIALACYGVSRYKPARNDLLAGARRRPNRRDFVNGNEVLLNGDWVGIG